MTNQIKQNKALVVVIAAIAATGGLLFGFDTGVISGAKQFFRQLWELSDKQVEWITTAGLIGAIAGAAFSGRLTDRLGRRVVILASAVIFGVGAIWTGAAGSPTSLFIGRLFLGIAIGVSSYTVPLYIAELSPSKHRGALVSAFQLMITIGILVSYLSDKGFIVENGKVGVLSNLLINMGFSVDFYSCWRPMFYIGIIPALILLIGMLFLPETPRFLISKGKEEAGRKILQRIEEPGQVEPSIAKMKEEIAFAKKNKAGAGDILKPWLRNAMIIGIGIMFVQQFVGINTVIYYSPEIFAKAGFASVDSQLTATVTVGLVNVFFTIVSMFIIDRIGRRKLYFFGLTGITIALIALGISFALMDKLGDSIKMITVISILFYILFFAISLGPLGWLIISEVYPLHLRGTGSSIGALSNWTFNAIVTFTFLSLLKLLGPSGAFFLYAAIGVIGLIWGVKFIPETKGKTLEQIEEHWRSGKKPNEL
ncbi:MAG: sugar porter family MFS transporter [Bacteroidota bacterium]